MAMPCPKCSYSVPSDGNRLPPWCPRCGADLKPQPADAPPPPPVLPPVPESPVAATLPAVIKPARPYEPMRFQLDWTEPRAFRALMEPSSAGLVNWYRFGCGSSVFL